MSVMPASPPSRLDILRPFWPVLSLILILLLFVIIAQLFGDRAFGRVIVEALIRVVMVVGIYIFVGNTGVLSFGHISFAAIGAFGAGWLSLRTANKLASFPGLPDFILNNTVPPLPTAIISGVLAALFALVAGAFILRLTGIGAAIATFAVLAILHSIYSQWENVTCGTCTLLGFPRYVDVWVAFGWASATICVAYLYQISSFGLTVRASRDDEVAARASGVRIVRHRLLAFVISAFFVGVAGALHASTLGSTTLSHYWLEMTFITLVMLIVGGMGSLSGAVLGVVVISALIWCLRRLEVGFDIGGMDISVPGGVQELGLAVVILAILMLRPRGITNWREITWPFGARGSTKL